MMSREKFFTRVNLNAYANWIGPVGWARPADTSMSLVPKHTNFEKWTPSGWRFGWTLNTSPNMQRHTPHSRIENSNLETNKLSLQFTRTNGDTPFIPNDKNGGFDMQQTERGHMKLSNNKCHHMPELGHIHFSCDGKFNVSEEMGGGSPTNIGPRRLFDVSPLFLQRIKCHYLLPSELKWGKFHWIACAIVTAGAFERRVCRTLPPELKLLWILPIVLFNIV